MVDRQQHWEGIYSGKSAEQVSWFQPHAASSLRLIADGANANAHIIDVGGGVSHAEFGAAFRLLGHETEVHHTPTGKEQEFVYCYCVRV